MFHWEHLIIDEVKEVHLVPALRQLFPSLVSASSSEKQGCQLVRGCSSCYCLLFCCCVEGCWVAQLLERMPAQMMVAQLLLVLGAGQLG